MNDYQMNAAKKYADSKARLELIVARMNHLQGPSLEWHIEPMAENLDYFPTYLTIAAIDPDTPAGSHPDPLRIHCSRDEYGHRDRWEFSASGWPSYTDQNGHRSTVDPSSLWNPKEVRPSTTAAQDRDPDAIARQIVSKVVPEYLRIRLACRSICNSREQYANRSKEALQRLADACHDTGDNGRHSHTLYVRDLPGDALRIEYRSVGDCQLNLSTDETIEVIALIRRLRTDAEAAGS